VTHEMTALLLGIVIGAAAFAPLWFCIGVQEGRSRAAADFIDQLTNPSREATNE
jgi:hypothetical protein